ncbi:hypothetical protein IVB18_05320 [Bradyrhizobium sp. 186]|uniref:hypothetical protein n=1 Tax=Bradyrhizobium sp. 186 TaxID=2782654 RepID=UPI0020006612|nr:hypothetical protein [Bradyrhizobium sp. 186]UPK31876.1 hypothetical protein IVB18_26480 [Bradyrhizobium sp. 186]UPK36770.1 hypothetical protein IVB18_05320 [Bradyrhizobium sp. 186]
MADIGKAIARPDGAQAHHSEIARRSFASFKFDWMSALAADPRLDARAKVIGNCILSHINQHSGEAILSDRSISDETAIPERGIIRGRGPLRKHGWVDWRRTGGANVYRVRSDHIVAMNDRLARLKSQRNADTKSRKGARRVAPSVAERDYRNDMPPVAERKNNQPSQIGQSQHCDPSPVAEHVQPPVADKHLNGTPSSTPIIPPRFVRRPLRGIGLEEGEETATTIDQWLASTTIEHRAAELMPCAHRLGLSRDQTRALADEFARHCRATNKRSNQWPVLCRRWLRTHTPKAARS